MLSLAAILRSHAPLLVLDASATTVHVGWIPADPTAARWTAVEGEAGQALFTALRELAVSPAGAAGFVFCEGPGSILGIRTAAVAIRTWVALQERPVFSYRSLALVAQDLGADTATVICDARRQSWHVLRRGENGADTIARIPTAELSVGPFVTPAGFRCWSKPPQPPPAAVPYRPFELSGLLRDAPLLRPAPEPDAFLHEEPDYVTWSPQIHRAPEPSA